MPINHLCLQDGDWLKNDQAGFWNLPFAGNCPDCGGTGYDLCTHGYSSSHYYCSHGNSYTQNYHT